ncbi:MAG: GNAT family N-acetyltransferase [Candidatus Pacearchaeota archaeon]
MIILKAENFILRPARLSDARNIYQYQQESETKRNFMSVPKGIAEVKKDILQKHKNSEKFVIEVEGEAVGEIGAHDIIKNHKAVISYWLAKKCRGKGITTKAVKILTDYLFNKYKLVRIQGNVRTFNKASARVLEKAGYKLEGILKKNKLKNGKYLDDMIWAKTK